MTKLLPIIKQQAERYESWTEAAARPGGSLSTTELAVYRMHASGIEVLKPLLIWLHEPGRNLKPAIIDQVIQAAESWVIRRQLIRMTNSDLGRIVADIIAIHSTAVPDDLAQRIISHLARLNVTSTYWPGDEEIRRTVATESVYQRFRRPRLRMFLEALEDDYRAETGQPQIERKGYPIEHLLPRTWQDTWPVDTPEAAEERSARINRLGNLTLLTRSLNSKVSNGPWQTKRSALQDHNTIILTGRVIKRTEHEPWDEALIDARTGELIDRLLKVWPVPEGHEGKVIDPQAKAGDWVELNHLIEAELLAGGDKLFATHRDFRGTEATLNADGTISLAGKRFNSPSAASNSLHQSATNGWYFWATSDGRRLHDVRTQFQNSETHS